MESLETLSFKGQKELSEKLDRLAKIVNPNKKEREEYEECLKVYRDNENVLDYAIEKAEAAGEARGFAEGRAEAKAFAEGFAKGFAKGIAEVKHLVASNLKKRGFAPDIIAQGTGLSVEEIEQLK